MKPNMKKKLSTIGKIIILLLSVTTLFSACGEDKYYPVENEVLYDLAFHNIKKADWKWNDQRGRYEVVFDVPSLTKEIYNNGIINASVFITESGGYEVQTNLPYIETWLENGETYTETLKYDISFNDKTIAYYLQSSDLGRDDYYLPDYQIKLSYIYYPKGY